MAADFPYHAIIVDNLVGIFKSYCREKKCGVAFSDNIDVHLPDGNLFRPDVSIFCNPSSINIFGKINGVPDLVVEVLSASTMKNDRTKKKDIYERNGVREYWIVDQWKKFVEVYHSVDGKFELDEIYVLYTSEEWEALTDKEREAAQFEIKVSMICLSTCGKCFIGGARSCPSTIDERS